MVIFEEIKDLMCLTISFLNTISFSNFAEWLFYIEIAFYALNNFFFARHLEPLVKS